MSCSFADMILTSVTVVVLYSLRAFFKRFGVASRSHQLLLSLVGRAAAPRLLADGLDAPTSTPQELDSLYADRSFVEV